MATAVPVGGASAADDGHQHPTCPMCLELFRFPVTLQCGHSVCKGCALGGHASSGATRHIEVACVLCRDVSRYTSERDLRINQDLAEAVYTLLGDAVAAPQCHRCEKHEAALHCSDCSLPLCTTCSDIIHVGRLRQHNIVYNSSKLGTSQPPRCIRAGHEAYRTDLYCTDCDTLLCVLCGQTEFTHRAHNVVPIAEAAVREKDKLKDVVAAANRLRGELKGVCDSLDVAMETIDRSTTEELLIFEHTIDFIKERLDAKKTALMNQARAGADEQIQGLKAKRGSAVKLVTALNTSVAHVEKAMRQANHYALMDARVKMRQEMATQRPIAITPYTLPQFSIPNYQAMVDAVEAMGVDFGVLDDRLPEAVIHPSRLFQQRGFTFDRSTYGDVQIFNKGTSVLSTSPQWETVMSSTLLSEGVHHWEVRLDKYDAKNGHNVAVGVIFDGAFAMCDLLGEDDNAIAYSTGKGTKMSSGNLMQPYAAPAAPGDVIGVKLNFQTQQLEFFKNGVSMGLAFYAVSRPCYAAVSLVHTQQVSLVFPSKIPV